MVEQAGYPYKQGEMGIPFFKMSGEGCLQGGSGSTLLYYVDQDELKVDDGDNNSPFLMHAQVEQGILNLNLFTRAEDDNSSDHFPDFFASKFIDVALRHFSNADTMIEFFEAVWSRGINYHSFRSNYAKTKDPLFSVTQTWTYSQMSLRGFEVCKDPGSVLIAKDTVHVVFQRAEK